MSADKHLTIPGALEWDSGYVERFTIATLRYAGGSEHDVRYVSEVHYDAALAREAALLGKLDEWLAHSVKVSGESTALQKRLTVAEQRAAELESAAREMLRIAGIANQGSNAYNRAIINLHSALKPAS